MLTNRWRSQTQQTSKFTSFTMSCPLCTQEVTVHLHVDYTHACGHNHTSLSQSRPQFLASKSAKHLFTFYVNTSQNTAMCILPPQSSQKAFTQQHKHAKYSTLLFPLHHKVFGWWPALPSPTPLGPMDAEAKHTLQGEGVSCSEGGWGWGGGNKGRQLWGLALHAVSSPFGTVVLGIRLAVVAGSGHLLTLLT